MPDMTGVKPGDELLLITKLGGSREREQEGQPVIVHKVARKLLHVHFADRDPKISGTTAYRIENGVINDNYGHSVLYTRQQWADEKRRDEITKALREHGVEVWRGEPKPINVLEAILDILENGVK